MVLTIVKSKQLNMSQPTQASNSVVFYIYKEPTAGLYYKDFGQPAIKTQPNPQNSFANFNFQSIQLPLRTRT